ncbi:MAG: hypothetical protein AAF517_26435, partial [Planctomycetota bacterium]
MRSSRCNFVPSGSTFVFLACLGTVLWSVPAPLDAAPFRRGDANGDGLINIADPISILRLLFRGNLEAARCEDASDSNDDGQINLSDSVYTLSYLFLSGRDLPAPGLECGDDPSEDSLTCEQSSCARDPSPTIAAYRLAPNGEQSSLVFDGPLGFREAASFVSLYGSRFSEVASVVLRDDFGNV